MQPEEIRWRAWTWSLYECRKRIMDLQNPQLYSLLKRNFGHVRVSGGGSSRVSHVPDWSRKGRLRTNVTGGEYYVICCPFCNDTRYRLWINALWGTRDATTGRELWHLAICHNEQCLADVGHRMHLREMVHAFPAQSRRMQPVAPAPSPPGQRIELPELCVPVNSPDCPAHVQAYLQSRGFNLRELATHWGVAYTSESMHSRPRLFDRIVIPIWRPARRPGSTNQYLAGWQARAIGDGEPKYLNCTGMKKSSLLYGLPQALAAKGPVIVVEGVTDVWRLGRNAVALFGKSISAAQVSLLVQHFRSRPIIIMLDADASTEAMSTRQQVCAALKGFCTPRVQLLSIPAGYQDVGECPREELWAYIEQELALENGSTPAANRRNP